MNAPIRTTFAPGALRRSTLLRGALVAVGLFVVGVVFWATGSIGTGAGLVVIAILVGGVTAYALVTGLRPMTLSLGEDGIDVTVARKHFMIKWNDVGSWGVGEWTMGGFRDSTNPSLIVWPAAHVTDAGDGDDHVVWVPAGQCWRLSRVRYTDGTSEELEAAMNHFAADKRRQVGT